MKLATDIMQKSTITLPQDTQVNNNKPWRYGRILYCVFGGILFVLLASITVMMVFTIVFIQGNENSKPDSNGDEDSMTYMMFERLVDELDRVKTGDKSQDSAPDNVEANITYHLPGSGKTIQEVIVATDTEEDISTADIRIIFDYRNGHIVSRVYPSDNTTSDNECFVRTFDPSDPNEGTDVVKKILQTGKADEYVTNDTLEELYETTGEVFDESLLSDRAAEMCKNRDILLVSKKEETMSKDEEEGTSIKEKRGIRCSRFRCGYYCYTSYRIQTVRTCTKKFWRRTRCGYVRKRVKISRCCHQCYCI